MSKHWQSEWSDERSKRIKADQQVATLRDQLATVTLERDALRADAAKRDALLRECRGHLKGWKMSMLVYTPERLVAAIDAALQEKP